MTVGTPPAFVDPLGFDHKPLQVCIEWHQNTQATASRFRWNRKLMQTAQGKEQLRQIFQSCPDVAWSVHPDDHIQVINDHIFDGLLQHFSAAPAMARRRHVSRQKVGVQEQNHLGAAPHAYVVCSLET